jgi:hypothetical protein
VFQYGFIVLFGSWALAIGMALDSYALGFLIGSLSVVTGILFSIKDKIVEGPILEKFSEIFLTTNIWKPKNILLYAQIERNSKD